ncbi:MAG: gamma-glutamylcyclotransferase [Brevinematales bacterium]|nr:gamma-glutamylcyclotransferase [Brevinematales bacterium]
MLLFVYGTLRRGKKEHSLLANSPFVASGYVEGTLYDLGVGFPALGLDEVQGRVYGEVYEVSEDLLQTLDHYEGCSPENEEESLYIRQEITFYPEKGKPFPVVAYVMPVSQRQRFLATVIPSGRW